MSHEINNLISLIENTLEDDDVILNPDLRWNHRLYSSSSIADSYLSNGMKVLLLLQGQKIANAIPCTAGAFDYDDDPSFTYQPVDYVRDREAEARPDNLFQPSSTRRDGGPVYKEVPHGAPLRGAAARKALDNAMGSGYFNLTTDDGEVFKCSVVGDEVEKKTFTKNKKRYVAYYVEMRIPDKKLWGKVILKIVLSKTQPTEGPSPRSLKIKENKLQKINEAIRFHENRLKELYAMKEEWESKYE